jgi:hypothetical protein
MKNTLGDLNNYLFAQLERLDNDELKGEALIEEMNRTKTINEVATRIIANGSLVLTAKKLMDNREDADTILPKMLEG